MSDNKKLCKWLRDNSSGAYRPSAEAAELIEKLEAERDAYKEKLDKVNSLRQSCEHLAAIDDAYAEFAGSFIFLYD